MATFKCVGTPPQNDVRPTVGQDLVPQSLVTKLLAGNMQSSDVTAQINGLLTGYATTSQATTAMTGLATPSWIQSQAASYATTASAGTPNGPVPLTAPGGLVPVGQINAASTQTWPLPFWSPPSYNTAPVNATTDAELLYTMSVPDPGWPYVLLCTGMVDTQAALDDGTFAQVLVREGGPTGQIIAAGYGVGESYTGPVPGTVNSQAFINSTFACTGNWVTVSGMLANNGAGFTSAMVGNYLQAQVPMTAVVTASFIFAGAAPSGAKGSASVQTAVQIVDQAGNILVTGSPVIGNSGTVTATWTGPVAAGQLFGVQIGEASAATFAHVSSGSLTISAPQVLSDSMANVVPVPIDDQLSITGPTSLSIMLQSSSASSTQVTAGTYLPALWVMPIPWVAETAPPPVVFDAAGVGASASGTTFSYAHVLALGGYLIVDIVVDRASAITSASYGTQPLGLVRAVSFPSSAVSGAQATFYRYVLAGAASGTANVAFKLASTAGVTSCSVSYLNVASSVTSSVTATSGASQINLSCQDGQMMVATIATSSGNPTTPTGGTPRYDVGRLLIQDSSALSSAFGATLPSTQGWAAIGTVLVA